MKTNRIRVLFVNNTYGVGGGAMCLYRHLANLDQMTFKPYVAYARHHHVIGLIEKIEGVETREVPKKFAFQGHSHLLAFLFDEIPHMLRLARYVYSIKPDVIIANNEICQHWSTIILARLMGIPVIPIMRGGGILWRSKIDVFLSRWCAAVVCVSKDMLSTCQGFPQERCRVIYDGVDIDLFSKSGPSLFREKWAGGMKDGVVVTLVGRIDRRKGHDIFIRAANEICRIRDNVTFLMAGRMMEGQPGYYEELAGMIASDRIVFAGFSSDIPDVLRGTDIMTIPSKAPEGYPTVVLEAMAAGVPVIGSTAGGTPETIDDGINGYLFDAADTDRFTRLLLKLIDDKELREKMAREARKRAERDYRVQTTADRYKELILSVAKKRQ